mmetsp:Transcript_89192/g.238144  ORF Transcript_89192/g.238144 Transcript_89192/m.238144 type:complete len:176 (-) Transcript_89192:387-914(-)
MNLPPQRTLDTGGQNGQFSVGVLPFWHYECGIQQVYFALFLYNTEFRSFSGQCSLNIMALHGNLPDRTYRLDCFLSLCCVSNLFFCGFESSVGITCAILFCLSVAIFIVVRSTKHAWDYSTSLSILHFCITCAVTGTAPTNWAWWVTLIVATLIVSVSSELMCYFLHDLRDIQKT